MAIIIDLALDLIRDWYPIAALAIAISASLAALAYMIAHFLADDKLKAWSKSELMQVFYSILILALVTSFYAIFNTLLYGMASTHPQAATVCVGSAGYPAGSPPSYLLYYIGSGDPNADRQIMIPCHFALASNFLENIFQNAKSINRDLLGTASFYHVWSSATLTHETLPPPWVSVTVMPLACLSVISESLTTGFELTTRMMALVRLQQLFLAIVQQALFPMFLIAGIALRTFFFTRKLGGLMIALAISLYTVLPGVYAVAGFIFGEATDGSFSVAKLDYSKLPTPSFDPSDPQQVEESRLLQESLSDPQAKEQVYKKLGEETDFCEEKFDTEEKKEGFWQKAKRVLAFILDAFSLRWCAHQFEDKNWLLGDSGIFDNIARLTMYTTLVPFVAAMVAVVTTKVMSPLFGGDVDIPGLSRLI